MDGGDEDPDHGAEKFAAAAKQYLDAEGYDERLNPIKPEDEGG
jgi:hypothetical protein